MSAALAVGGARPPGDGDTLAPGMVGDQYSTCLTASGGSGNYQWELVSPPAMPSGLKLDSNTGEISGTPDRLAEGSASLTVQVTDADGTTTKHTFVLTINPGLQISNDVDLAGQNSVRLKATGGTGSSYHWGRVADSLEWIRLDADGTVTIIPGDKSIGDYQFTARVTDDADHTDEASFSVKVRQASWWRRRLSKKGDPGLTISILNIKVRAKRRRSFGRWTHLTFWLAILSLVTPIVGGILIIFYAFSTPGRHWNYLAVGMLTAFAAFLIGIFTGFLFGIPRVVSSGQVRQRQSSAYAPSSNLAEVSDWLTKLLLGAGLVQLTHLSAPISKLIDNVANGLHIAGTPSGAAKVTAGAILFGYTVTGLLTGYVVTTMWYQRKLAQLDL
jgi:hypothetical protein